ncbi:MAG: hypothetical protein ACRENE_26495, partial [Polyangiaceae bacterium]
RSNWVLSYAAAAAGATLALAACGNSSGGTFPGDDASSSGGGSSGTSSGSGGSSGSTSSGGGSSSGSGSSGGGGGRVSSQIMFADAGVPICGTACPLPAHHCCVSYLGAASCQPAGTACPQAGGFPQADFQCVEKSDCAGNKVCCGYADTTTIPPTAGASCQDTSTTGGACTPAPSSAKASAQLCQTNAECKGVSCLWQDCAVGTSTLELTMCGIQMGQVFNCHMH